MRSIVIESQYLPSALYFSLLASANKTIIDCHENYVRQTYRNRAEILGSNGKINLTIPVERGRSKQLMKDTRIDNTSPWQKIHWRGIRSSYGKSPFFEYYSDQLGRCYDKKYQFLTELNHDLMSCLIKLSGLELEMTYSENYIDIQVTHIEGYRSVLSPKKRNDYSEKMSSHAYPQVFGNKFVHGLSLVDLLFCEGPNAGSVIRNMAVLWQ